MKKQSVPGDELKNMLVLAEGLRDTIGQFVRAVRHQAGTPTTAQGETLAFLERNGPVSIAVLADNRGVKHQSMRLVIAKLEDSGFVVRSPDPADGRGWLVALTEAGHIATANARAARTSWLADVLATEISARERGTLSEALPILQKITRQGTP